MRSHSKDYHLYNAYSVMMSLTNATGATTKTHAYDAFGNEKVKDIYDSNPFRYCGEYYDAETGTYYLRARYYNPSLGRFTQNDSVRYVQRELSSGLWTIDPLSLNLYIYCYNNPIRFSDPSGHINKDEIQMYEDGKMSPAAYSYLMECTYNYYLSDTEAGREYWHNRAEKFRKTGYTDTGDKKWNAAIEAMPTRPTTTPTKEEHYFRNELNLQYDWVKFQKLNEKLPDYLKWEELPLGQSVFHKFEDFNNRKYVSACGHFEAVYTKDNKLVDERYSPIDMGTYNYYGPSQAEKHTEIDVVPWIKWGNTKKGWIWSNAFR